MENKVLTVAIIGLGGRGGYAYGPYLMDHPEKFKIVAVCDIDHVRLDKWGDIYKLPKENRFDNEEDFWKEKRADVIFITTMDRLHIRMAKKALELGYNILLEKPLSDSKEEIDDLVASAHKANRIIMVCHVLRYTVWINKCKELIDKGEIGRLVTIDHTENVVYWHEAHSFVRGNWHKREDCAPMIMAKCCHDLDLLQYFAHSRCKYISSMGDLRFFKKENKPKDSADRCTNCKYMETCTYSAKRIYVDGFIGCGRRQVFPFTLISDDYPVTEESMWKSIREGRYGKCVFACDNNVVDNQTVIMTFENGITATLKMEAFVRDGGRDIRFLGTDGEIDLREGQNTITLKKFTGDTQVWKINELTDDLEGHGGGDHRMLDKLYEVMALNNKEIETSIDASAESHYMAMAAEESRLDHGRLIDMDEFR